MRMINVDLNDFLGPAIPVAIMRRQGLALIADSSDHQGVRVILAVLNVVDVFKAVKGFIDCRPN